MSTEEEEKRFITFLLDEIEELGKQIAILEKKHEKYWEWMKDQLMTRDKQIEHLRSEQYQLYENHEYQINDLYRHIHSHPRGRD